MRFSAHYHDVTCIDLKSSFNSEIGIIRSGKNYFSSVFAFKLNYFTLKAAFTYNKCEVRVGNPWKFSEKIREMSYYVARRCIKKISVYFSH